MSGGISRRKGKVGELEISKELERRNLPYLREQDGRLQNADFLIDGRFAAEVKRRERLEIVAYHRELEAKTPDHLTPVVIWRPSREPWRASLLLDDFLDMAWEAST